MADYARTWDILPFSTGGLQCRFYIRWTRISDFRRADCTWVSRTGRASFTAEREGDFMRFRIKIWNVKKLRNVFQIIDIYVNFSLLFLFSAISLCIILVSIDKIIIVPETDQRQSHRVKWQKEKYSLEKIYPVHATVHVNRSRDDCETVC